MFFSPSTNSSLIDNVYGKSGSVLCAGPVSFRANDVTFDSVPLSKRHDHLLVVMLQDQVERITERLLHLGPRHVVIILVY